MRTYERTNEQINERMNKKEKQQQYANKQQPFNERDLPMCFKTNSIPPNQQKAFLRCSSYTLRASGCIPFQDVPLVWISALLLHTCQRHTVSLRTHKQLSVPKKIAKFVL